MTTNGVRVWLDDPADGDSPNGGVLAVVSVPNTAALPLPTQIVGQQPPPDVYPKGSPQFRYWVAASALRRASDYWGPRIGGRTWNPAVGDVLPVELDAGEDFNAFYDRSALRFFHGTANGQTVFSGESPDVVAHEFGHALLDSAVPALWDAASLEADAFHEAFGDCVALLSALGVQSVRERVLADTNGVLFRSSKLSRLAEQLGWAIRQQFPTAVEPDCLRNAFNSFFYQKPSTLPSSGPAPMLTSESHSFSRVFTGAFFEAVARVFAAAPTQDEAQLAAVASQMADLLISAVENAPVVSSYYAQVGAHLVAAAASTSAETAHAIRTAMVRHGILSTHGIAAVANAGKISVSATARSVALPTRDIDVTSLGLGVATLRIHAAAEPKRFAVSGAALHSGEVADSPADVDAREFLEQLIRRGRLDQGRAALAAASTGSQHNRFTHRLERDDDGVFALRRIRIDCGCARPDYAPRGPR